MPLDAGDAGHGGGVNPVGKGLPGLPQGECTHWDALGDLGNVGSVWAGMKDEHVAILRSVFCSWMLFLSSSHSEAEGCPKYILIPSLKLLLS